MEKRGCQAGVKGGCAGAMSGDLQEERRLMGSVRNSKRAAGTAGANTLRPPHAGGVWGAAGRPGLERTGGEREDGLYAVAAMRVPCASVTEGWGSGCCSEPALRGVRNELSGKGRCRRPVSTQPGAQPRGDGPGPGSVAEWGEESDAESTLKVELTGPSDGSHLTRTQAFHHLLQQPHPPTAVKTACQDSFFFFPEDGEKKSQQSVNSSIESPANVSVTRAPVDNFISGLTRQERRGK